MRKIILSLILILSLANFVNAGSWQQVPLRTQAQKDAGLFGGEGMEMIFGMSYAPTDPNIAYLVADVNQVWKSTDGGDSWLMKHNGFNVNGGVSLVVDPNNADIVFVAGSRCSGSPNPSTVDGIYRTQDGAETWERVRYTHFYRPKNDKGGVNFAFDPSDFDGVKTLTVYAGTHEEGLLKSTDGGDTWENLQLQGLPDRILDIKIDPSDYTTLYISTREGLFRVYNSGTDIVKIGESSLPDDFIGWTKSNDPAGATTSVDSTESRSGIKSAKVYFDGTANVNYWHVKLNRNVTSNTTYILEGYIKTSNLTVPADDTYWGGVGLVIKSGATVEYTARLSGTNDWTFVTATITTPSDATTVEVQLRRLGAGNGVINGTAWWDDIKLYVEVEGEDEWNMLSKPEFRPGFENDFPRAIAIAPNGADIYVTVGESGVYKSVDGGANFSPQNNGLSTPIGEKKVATYLAINPADSNYLYVSFQKWSSFYYSHDGGDTWLEPSTYDAEGMINDLYAAAGSWSGTLFAPHPTDRDTTLAKGGAASHPIKTTDGGATFYYSSNGYGGGRAGGGSTAFGFDPDDANSTVFFLGDFGPYLTEDDSTFRSLNTPRYDGLPASRTGAIDLKPGDGIIVTPVGSNDNQVIAVTRDLGVNWTLFDGTDGTPDTVGNYRFTAFHPQDRNIIYSGSWRSDDRGYTWTRLDKSIRAMFPGNGDIVYALGDNGDDTTTIWKSTDRGETWEAPYLPIPNRYPRVDSSEMAVDPQDQDRLYVGGIDALYIWDGSQWLVKNEADGGLALDQFGEVAIAHVTVDPNYPNRVYVGKRYWSGGSSNGVFRSVDYGLNFENITDNLGPLFTVWSLAVNPWNEALYVGSSFGTWKISSLAASWPMDEGEGYTTIYDKSINANDGSLTGGVAWTTGIIGSGLEFNGADGYVSIPDNSSLDMTESYTVEGWFKIKGDGDTLNGLFGKNGVYRFYCDNNNKFWMQHWNTNGDKWTSAGISNFMSRDSWYHIAVTFDRPTIRVYRNGEEVANWDWDDSLRNSSYPFYIGTIQSNLYYFNGTIDGVKVYNRALTVDEIKAEYSKPIPLESGVPQTGSVSQGEWSYYKITSSATDTEIKVALTSLSDDVNLYVRADSLPDLDNYDCRPYEGGTTEETCSLPNTEATTWYIGVYGYQAGSFAVTATLIVSDDFNDGDDNGWTPVSGAWQVVNGEYKEESLSTGAPAFSLMDYTYTTQDMTIEVRGIDQEEPGAYQNFFVVFAYDEPTGKAYWAGARVGVNSWTIEEIDIYTGSVTTLAYISETINTKTWYDLKLIVSGDTVTLYADCVEKVGYIFPGGIPVGEIGLGGHNNHAHFDDFILSLQ